MGTTCACIKKMKKVSKDPQSMPELATKKYIVGMSADKKQDLTKFRKIVIQQSMRDLNQAKQ